jgi:hypothetical protein
MIREERSRTLEPVLRGCWALPMTGGGCRQESAARITVVARRNWRWLEEGFRPLRCQTPPPMSAPAAMLAAEIKDRSFTQRRKHLRQRGRQ